jgi:hypothetical protein
MSDVELTKEVLHQILESTRTIAKRFASIKSVDNTHFGL